MRDEAISEILYEYPADILVGSHTHSPLERTWGDHIILNTGAVGCPFNHDRRAQYLILELKEGQWRYSFQRVAYDVDAALAVYESSGLLAEGGLGAHLFYLELKTARSFYTPFWMWAEKQQLDHTWPNWERFKEANPERFETP